MPIYKLSASNLFAGVRRSQPTPNDAPSVGPKANGDVVDSGNRGHDTDNPYAQRPSPAEREIDFGPKKASFNRKESIIEREIREQLRRESELAALRGLPTLVRVSLDQVDQNEDHHHHHHRHQTPEQSSSYYEVQVLPPEHHRSPSREERKLTVIGSPGGATSSTMIFSTTTTTTTTTSTTPSVNGSKPGKVDYHREERDDVEQKGREEEEDVRRGRWKELGVDLDAENLTNERWTEGKGQPRVEKSGDVFEPGIVDWIAEEKMEKETRGEEEERHAIRELWSPSGDVQRNLHRVQPFEEVDSIQSELFAQYVPQSETPIEGEIRRASEREEALRAARGLLSLVPRDSVGAEAGIEVMVRPPRMVDGGGGGGGVDHSSQENDAMKRFAENRLRTELEREKRRELDLLREGKIILLSEQRVLGPSSSPPPSRSKVSSETEELREFARRRSLEYRNSESDVTGSGAGRRNTDAAATENRTAFSANPRMSYGDKGVTVVWSDARMSPSSGEGGARTHSVTEAEHRIENEITELRKRESELREQRRSRNSDVPVEASAAQPEIAEERGAHAQAAKPEVVAAPAPSSSSEAARRRQSELRLDGDYDSVDLGRPARLALIDQWERGIIQRGGITT